MNKKIIFSFLLLALCAKADEPYNSFIEKWEGRKHKIYIDSLGNSSIGVGFNLLTASEDLKRAAKSGELTDGQIDYFLEREVITAKRRAIRFFPTFYNQPQIVKNILVDMSYNLGNRIEQFVKFKAAIDSYDYKTASDELLSSLWFNQTRRRSLHHYWKLKNLHSDKDN